MAKKFLTPIDLTNNEIRNVIVQNLSAAPGATTPGQIYYNSTDNVLYWRNNTTWVAATAGGTAGGDLTGSYPNPTIANNAVTGAKVNASSVGSVLLLSGSAASRPAAAAANSGLYYFANDTNGGTLYQSNGSTWTQVAKGVSESAVPSGSAGGDLTGTYPNPTIGSNKVDSTKINQASVASALLLSGTLAARPAAVAGNSGLYYFATDSSGGTLYQSNGSTWTQLARGLTETLPIGNIPTGTSSTTDASHVVRTDDSRLSDQRVPTPNSVDNTKIVDNTISWTKLSSTPSASIPFNNQRLTGLADPTSAQDAATKNYVDTMAGGLDFKASVRASTTGVLPNSPGYSNGVLTATTNGAFPALDGVTLSVGDRVLVKDQASGLQNGIYTVTNLGSAGTGWVLTRAADSDTTGDFSGGTLTYVESGTTNGSTQWVISNSGPITLGTTAITWVQFSGVSALTAGNGLTTTGNVLNVNGGPGITVDATNVNIDTTIVARKTIFTIGDGVAVTFNCDHNYGNQWVSATLINATTLAIEETDIVCTNTNRVTVNFSPAQVPASGAYKLVVIG